MTNQTGTSRFTVFRSLRSGVVASLMSVLVSLAILPMILRETSLATYGAWVTLGGLLAIARLTESGIPTEVARRVAVAEGNGDRAAARRAVQQAISVMCLLSLGLLALGAVGAVTIIPALFEGASSAELRTLQEVWLCTVLLLAVSLVMATWFATLGGLQRHDFGAYAAVVGSLANAAAVASCSRLASGSGPSSGGRSRRAWWLGPDPYGGCARSAPTSLCARRGSRSPSSRPCLAHRRFS